MKNVLLLLFILFFATSSFCQKQLIFQDLMDGNNTIPGLQARGWVILNEDGGGAASPWFQGNKNVFKAFQGPDSGYVASNYAGANSNAVIDQWLISPSISIQKDDSLSFYARSDTTSGFIDSINILISSNAGTTPSDFQDLGRFELPKNKWEGYFVTFNGSAIIRFAVRYFMSDSSIANYIGLDNFQIFRKITYPSTIQLSNNFTFNDPTKSSSYRMIGLPGNDPKKLSDVISGTYKTDWKAFFDNGASQNFLVEYDGSANFSFSPGKGFWVLSKNQINVTGQVNTVNLVNNSTYAIPLHDGFNIISDPFEKGISWSSVQNANNLNANEVISEWNGAWASASQMEPYKAYYFNNVKNLTSLKIPYITQTTKALKENSNTETNENSLKLSLTLDGKEKSHVIIGVNKNAKDDFDIYDYFAPPGNFDEVRIHVEENNLTTNYKQLFVDYRPEINNGQTFNLRIKNTTGKTIKLSAEGLKNFDNYQIFLVDEKTNEFFDLNEKNQILLPSNFETKSFKLLIGNEDYINYSKKSSLPKSFALSQNYPNPFNPSTNIQYAISSPANGTGRQFVTLKVYDILGNEVATLVNKQQSPGNYEVEFYGTNPANGTGLASGIYFYELRAGDFIQSRKMILMK